MLNAKAPKMLGGIVVGGKLKNMHIDKRPEKIQGQPVSKEKTPVFGMLQRNGNVDSMPVKDTKKITLHEIINKSIRKGTKLMSDEHTSYTGLNKKYNHRMVFHSLGEHKNGNVHINTLEGFWSLLKRGIVGIYHSVSDKHLEKYCNEFDFRYDTKDMTEQDRFDKSISQCNGRLKYSQLIA